MTSRHVVTSRLIASLAVLVALSGCGSSVATTESTHRSASAPPASTATTTTAITRAPTTSTPTAKPHTPPPAPRVNPGKLPQTNQLPTSGTAGFHAEMAALWAGVRDNSVARAMPAFFPEAAYAQVKAIGDPQADWADRLVGDLRLDLAAAHALLGADPGSAQLVSVQVPGSYAHWVDPGACYNRVGYYEVPNARVVYRQHGQISSFGIASMISWRGVWYVVHLGAVLRSTAGGAVDDPSAGPGESAPSSTC